MNPSLTKLDLDRRLHGFLASENGEIHHRFTVASLIRGSQAQCRSSYAVDLLEHFDLFTHFFPGSRHLGFEDIQAMIDLISDPRQISGLPSDLILDNTLLSRLCDLLCNLCTFQHPLPPSGTGIQREWTNTIRRCNEASTLPCKEVTFNGLPIYGQYFAHKPSLYRLSCTMQAFFESKIRGCHSLPPAFGKLSQGGGDGEPYRDCERNHQPRSNQ